MYNFCMKCGFRMSDEALFCPSCGAKKTDFEAAKPVFEPVKPGFEPVKPVFETSPIYCEECGYRLTRQMKSCPSCGKTVEASAIAKQEQQAAAVTPPPPVYTDMTYAQGYYGAAPSNVVAAYKRASTTLPFVTAIIAIVIFGLRFLTSISSVSEAGVAIDILEARGALTAYYEKIYDIILVSFTMTALSLACEIVLLVTIVGARKPGQSPALRQKRAWIVFVAAMAVLVSVIAYLVTEMNGFNYMGEHGGRDTVEDFDATRNASLFWVIIFAVFAVINVICAIRMVVQAKHDINHETPHYIA